MKKILISTLIALFIMGLFSFFKKEKEVKDTASSIILGMVLLEESIAIEMNPVVNELRKQWKLSVDDSQVGTESSVLVIDGYNVAIGYMPIPIPEKEIKSTAQYNYFWENGEVDALKHNGHLIISLLNAGKDPVKENLIFSKVVSSVLNNSESLGIYIGGRTLLLKKDFYLDNVQNMSHEDLPLYNWIYFGLRSENGRQSVYTYGLSDFNKLEMEIVDSKKSLEELSGMMFNLSNYVIASNVRLRDGETIGMSAEQKLKITESKGKYINGNTLKVKY